MAAARAGDPARTDLALLRDVPPQLVEVLVVDLVDLLLAEVARSAPARRRHRRAPAPALLLLLSVAGSGHRLKRDVVVACGCAHVGIGRRRPGGHELPLAAALSVAAAAQE